MPASLLQCHRLQCAARALLRRALRSGHVAALGPFRGARAMLLRSGHAAALGPASLAVALLFPSVLCLVCAGLFAMGHIGIQGASLLLLPNEEWIVTDQLGQTCWPCRWPLIACDLSGDLESAKASRRKFSEALGGFEEWISAPL